MAISASSPRGGAKADINVTPMIDVMLVLLIIFMIVTPAIVSGIPAVMPRGQNPEQKPEEPDEIRLLIDRAGQQYLDITQTSQTSVPAGLSEAVGKGPRVIAEADLPNALAALFCNRTKDRILFLKADNQLEFGRIQEAMEVARKSCVRVIAAVTEQIQPLTVQRKEAGEN